MGELLRSSENDHDGLIETFVYSQQSARLMLCLCWNRASTKSKKKEVFRSITNNG